MAENSGKRNPLTRSKGQGGRVRRSLGLLKSFTIGRVSWYVGARSQREAEET
ncbi:MAG TPA: hypothetical protein V6D26_06640 [Stenomitos sp.]